MSKTIYKSDYVMKPLFKQRMQTLLQNPEDFSAFEKIIHTSPKNFIRCNTIKISPSSLLQRLQKKWQVTQPYNNHPEILLIKGKKIDRNNDISNQTSSSPLNQNNYLSNSYIDYSSNNRLSNLNYQKNISGINTTIQITPLNPGELGNAIEHILGYYYIQEISSMLPPIALDPKPGELVLDLFASPGSKTTQIASMMQNQGTLIANELKLDRIKILTSNLERCGVTNTIVSRKDAIAFCANLSKSSLPKFDKILLDVPCSGEGTLRSSPKTFLMWNHKVIEKLSRQQKKFFAFALRCLKLNGTLVYSTCTHAPEENEEIIDFALKNFPVKLETLALPIKCRQGITEWNTQQFSNELKKTCRIYPQDNDSEGFFVAKLTLLKEII